jgi:hypothetical protein
MAEPQTLANHARIDPWYHWVALPLSAITWILAIIHVVHHGRPMIWQLIAASALLVVMLRVRIYSLRVQDRVIRLEETLRMQALLPTELKARIGELRPGQFVALRFASDAELAERVEEALTQGLAGRAIKERIKQWRPDTFRV